MPMGYRHRRWEWNRSQKQTLSNTWTGSKTVCYPLQRIKWRAVHCVWATQTPSLSEERAMRGNSERQKNKKGNRRKNRAGARRVSGVAMCWRVNMRHADRSSHGHKTEKTSQTPSKHSHGHTVYYGKCTVILKLAWKSRSNPGMPAASDSHAWHCSPLHKVRLSTSRQSYYFTLLRGAEPFFSFRLKSACCNCKNVPM